MWTRKVRLDIVGQEVDQKGETGHSIPGGAQES